ncbi:hypothetical protein N7481_008223 [Penicillium waksmanii]|uniref:uncharacterized protein n=1 Tax=Penicillium waksmanii TaxID=69791 RepID=UPI00254666D0|nr:uncharacterized protein N7481_008223 [Penicillium waksmanii]KAJ5980925.1 hypothetical protein N7481_008223 [Penicillium waksmanii]
MRAEISSKSTSNDETPSQKQDPLERRRLQNRLSQRNHRRKIRDRIAKLQERVIANELRAAAALNGWDQPYSPSPLLSPRHVSRPQNDLQVNSRDTSPMATEPPTPFTPSFNITQTSIWPGDFNFAQSSGWITGDIPLTVDGGSFMNDTMCYTSSEGCISTGIQVPKGICHEGNLMYDAFSDPSLIHTNLNNGIQASQSLYYVATETSFPQILQAMRIISPQTKIIVLVPPEPASTYPSPPPSLLGSNVLDGIPSPQAGIQSPACQCQSQSAHLAPNNVQALSRWTAPGSFSSGCPSHKISTPSGGSFPGIR